MILLKRIITALCLLLCLLLTSCSVVTFNRNEENEQSAAVTSGQSESESGGEPLVTDANKSAAEEYLSALDSRNYEGSGFVIATTDSEFFVPSSSKNDWDTARVWRNKAVGEKFNVKITTRTVTTDELEKNLTDSMLSGEYTADLIAIPANTLGAFISKGLLLNAASLPFTDFSQSYYNKININQASGGDNIYAISGDFTYDISKIFVVYFNRALFESLGLELPYELAKSGGFTWDKLGEIVAAARAAGSEATPIGAADESILADTAFASAGRTYIDGGQGKTPEPILDTEENAAFAEKLGYILKGSVSAGEGALGEFLSGNMLFYVGEVSDIETIKTMSDRWGILPMPKENEGQENYQTRLASDSLVIVCPTVAVDVEKSGRILQALSAASYLYVGDSYYDYLLENCIRDTDALEMLDCIRAGGNNTATLEMSQYFSETRPAIAAGSRGAFSDAVFGGSLPSYCKTTYSPLLRALRQQFPEK